MDGVIALSGSIGRQYVAQPEFFTFSRPLPIATDEDDDCYDDCTADSGRCRYNNLIHVGGSES